MINERRIRAGKWVARVRRNAGLAASGILLAVPALAQPAPPQGAPAQQTWQQLPRMQLERQFAGPLQDTIIQRWRDPVDGMICYMYLPITAQHSPPTASGYVQYGANTIGSISCTAEAHAPSPPSSAAAAPRGRTPTAAVHHPAAARAAAPPSEER